MANHDTIPTDTPAASPEPCSQWSKRRTVLREIRLGEPGAGKFKMSTWDPNLWRLSYQGTLSLLRAEALRARLQCQRAEENESGTDKVESPRSHPNKR